MKLGIMQPYFFPYIGYFELIAKTDFWIFFDTPQYNPKSWMNRNRVLHPDKSNWQYINIPVNKVPKGTSINAIECISPESSLQKIISQITHYKKHAPYFNETINVINNGFNNRNSDSLLDINISTISSICDYFDLPLNYELSSNIQFEIDTISHAGDWALSISRELNAKTYINPPGGKDIFRPDDWVQAGINLEFLPMNNLEYSTKNYAFIENLSIIDVMMWNSKNNIIDIFNCKGD